MFQSEVRHSTVRELADKVRKRSYSTYLVSIRLEGVRMFAGAQIDFDFPVTALIGPNGGGKSTVLNAAWSAYSTEKELRTLFRKSRIGDESMDAWVIELSCVDKSDDLRAIVRSTSRLSEGAWFKDRDLIRTVHRFGLSRTVPPGEHPMFANRNRLSSHAKLPDGTTVTATPMESFEVARRHCERIL